MIIGLALGESVGIIGMLAVPQELFYVPRDQAVRESLVTLALDRPRVYPALKTMLAAVGISALPLLLLCLAMSCRPRRQ